jgi:hypothetical protein
MANSNSSTDSRDNIPLSQITSTAAAREKLYSGALRDVMDPPRDKFDGDKDTSEDSNSDDGAYRPRPAQRSRDRGR